MENPEKQIIIQKSRSQKSVLDNLLFINFCFATSLPKETQLFYALLTFSSSRSTSDLGKQATSAIQLKYHEAEVQVGDKYNDFIFSFFMKM